MAAARPAENLEKQGSRRSGIAVEAASEGENGGRAGKAGVARAIVRWAAGVLSFARREMASFSKERRIAIISAREQYSPFVEQRLASLDDGACRESGSAG